MRLTVTDENRYPDSASCGDKRLESKQQQWSDSWSDRRSDNRGDSRRVDRLRMIHGLNYNHSMLEY